MTVPAGLRLFDSHLHLTDSRFEADRAQVLVRAREAGVAGMVTVASDVDDARRAIALAAGELGLWATAGLHPHRADRWSSELEAELRDLLDRPEVVAVGETGLDHHYERAPREAQRESFRGHLRLAEAAGLPAVVHSREADVETAEAIREFAGRAAGVLHCFTGGDGLLDEGLAAGWHVSFSGIVTFGEPELEGRLRRVPDERLLLETDSPYLAPVPRRGRRNEPAHLVHTCEAVARLRGTSPGELAELTRKNAMDLYRLPGDG